MAREGIGQEDLDAAGEADGWRNPEPLQFAFRLPRFANASRLPTHAEHANLLQRHAPPPDVCSVNIFSLVDRPCLSTIRVRLHLCSYCTIFHTPRSSPRSAAFPHRQPRYRIESPDRSRTFFCLLSPRALSLQQFKLYSNIRKKLCVLKTDECKCAFLPLSLYLSSHFLFLFHSSSPSLKNMLLRSATLT